MLTTLILLATLAADAGLTAEAAQAIAVAGAIDLEADTIVADPVARTVALSAAKCEAQARLKDSWDSMLIRKDKPARRAYERAQKHAEQVELVAGVMEIELKACSAWDVAPVVECLATIPASWCARDQHVQAMVEAADRLMETPKVAP